jgi:3D-(3,5/4)-trihydroxycyclohexane-1,2-dione acylhydrolase (decyclizing)
MSTIRLTTAQALIKFLNNQYVEFDGQQTQFVKGIFTIFGHGNVVGLGQALEQDAGNLTVLQGRNEQGMVHAATGYAKQKLRKQIYACTSSVGPGAANMVTAAATATANRIPVLLLPGDTYACRQPDPVLQQLEQFDDLGLTTNDAFRSVCKYWDRINRPEQLMSAMISAMRVLADPADTGAVAICLPQDVEGEAYDYPDYFFAKRVHRIERIPATDAMISEAAAVIKKSKKPMIICGGGVRYSEAADTLKDFAETFNIPFGETQAGKSAIVFDHPLNLGGVGATGCLAANLIAKEADLIIGIGTRYTDFTTASKWLFKKDANYVNINIGAFDAYKMDAVKVVADAKVALEMLQTALKSEAYRSGYNDEISDAKGRWATELDRLFNIEYNDVDFTPEIDGHLDDKIDEYKAFFDGCMTQTKAIGILDDELDDDAVVVGSSGSLPGDLQRVWRPKQRETYHMEYGYSAMGYEVAAAFGVKLACPDQEVYSMLGDGSFMMLHSELVTAMQERKKINLVVMDNAEFGCINNLQMERGQGSFGTEFRYRDEKTGMLTGDLMATDFAKIGEGYGAKGYNVRTEDELRAALKDAKKQSNSTVIDIKVLPKTMTHGYEGFWRCGTAEVALSKNVVDVTDEQREELKKARQY